MRGLDRGVTNESLSGFGTAGKTAPIPPHPNKQNAPTGSDWHETIMFTFLPSVQTTVLGSTGGPRRRL